MGVEFGGSGITLELFQWICHCIPKGSHILELGAGDVSTQYLSERYRLTSVEHDERWIGRYPNVHYIHAPLVDDQWYDVEILAAGLAACQPYKLIIVDGPVGSKGRLGFESNLSLFDTSGVPIAINDSYREHEAGMVGRLASKLHRTVIDRVQFSILP